MKIRKITTCHTCRTRKLACDGKTPACTQCTRSGRTCAGYQHDLIFRPPTVSAHHQAPIANAKRRHTSFSSDSKTKRQSRRLPKAEPKLEREHAAELVLRQRPSTVRSSLSWPLLDIISLVVQNFSPSEFLERPCRASSASGTSAQRICGAWVEALPELARNGQADRFLSPSIKTLAVSIVSRGKHGRAPVSDALEAQALALSSLQSGLWQMAASNSNLLAAATMCLFLSEVILPTSTSSAPIHAKAIGDLLQLQDPEFYSSGVSHQLFVGFRPVMIINFFMSRQHPFLAQARWLEAPFSKLEAGPLQNLFSEMIHLPVTHGIVDGLGSMPLDQAELVAQTVLSDFDRWIRRLISLRGSQGDGSEFRYFSTGSPTDDRTALQFSSITAANFFTHIWAFHIVCARNIRKVVSLFPCLVIDVEPSLENLISEKMLIQMATLIFRSIEFLTRDEFKLFGAASTVLPLRLAGEVLRNEGADNADLWHWYHEVSRISEATGYHIMMQQMLEY